MKKFFNVKSISAVVMLIISCTCVAVQYNDPDGWVWMLIYSYAVGVSGLAVFGRYGFWALAGAVGYLLLGIWVTPWAQLDSHLFGVPNWHMGPDSNEEAREAGGVFLLALWQFTVGWWWWAERHPRVNAA